MTVKQFTGSRRLPALLLAAALALAVTACGSSKSNSGSGSGGTTDAAAATSGGGSATANKSPYVIGSVVSETGPFASSDGSGAKGVQAWASYVNSHGGINGHKVQLTVKDDQGNPSTALSEVKAFAADKNVLALVGSVSSEEGSWGPVASALKLPVVGDFPFTPVSYSYKYVYPQGTTFPSALYGEVYAAVKLGKHTKLGLAYCAEESACAGSVAPVKAFAKSLGGTLVNSQAVPATAPNYDAPCTAFKNSGATALVVALGESTISSMAQSCASVAYHPTYLTQSTAATASEQSNAALNNHLYSVEETFPWISSDTPAQRAFQAGVKSISTSKGYDGPAAALGWTGGALFDAGVSSIKGSVTRQSLANAIEHLPKGTTLGGLAPPLTYKPNSATPQVKCFYVAKLIKGKWTAPYGGKKYFCQH